MAEEYRPEPVETVGSLADVMAYVQRELHRIAVVLADRHTLLFWHKSPAKPRDGMILGIDGTDWNPTGEGEWIYAFFNGKWNKLGPGGEGDMPTSGPYDIHFFLNRTPVGNERLCMVKFPRVVAFEIDMPPSQGTTKFASANLTEFDIRKNGVSIGKIRWAATITTATFHVPVATVFAIGDVLEVVAPSTPDATLSQFSAVLVGTRVI